SVEALQCRGIIGPALGQDLDGGPAAHELVLAQVDAPHTARRDLLQHLVLADGEAPPASLQELLRLKARQDAVADEKTGDLTWLRRDRTASAQFIEIGAQAFLFHNAAFSH